METTTMASDFDSVKAQREITLGLTDVHKVIHTRAREAERRMSEAESDYNSLLKLEKFTEELLKQAREKLQALEREQEKKDKGE